MKQSILVIIFSFTLLNQLCLASESVKNDTGSDGKTKGETIAGNITGGGGRVQGRSVSSLLRSWDPIGKFTVIKSSPVPWVSMGCFGNK